VFVAAREIQGHIEAEIREHVGGHVWGDIRVRARGDRQKSEGAMGSTALLLTIK